MKKQIVKDKKESNNKNSANPKNLIWNKSWFLLLILFIVTVLLYFQALNNDFTNWDDHGYVIENNYVQHFTISSVASAFKTLQVMGNYHPLSMISLGIDHLLFHDNASGYHRTNLIIHLINIFLLFFFMQLLFSNNLIAFISSLLFAIHPMHVESVAWISERKDVLYVCFYFAAAVAWMKYLKSGTKKIIWYVAAAILFVCSLLAKGQAVTFSVLIVLIDLLMNRKLDKKYFIEKIPFFLLSITFGLLAIKAQQASSAINFIPFYSWTDRLLFASYALYSYIYNFFLPIRLSAFHPYPLKTGMPFPIIYYLSPVFLLIIFSALIFLFRKNRVVWFGAGFFLVNIALILQLLPVGNAIYAERYTYLSYTGIIIMIAYGINYLHSKNENKFRKLKTPALILLSAFCIFFFIQTSARIKVWKNSETLWLDVISKYDYAPNAFNNLGSYYQKDEQLDKALYNFNNALRLQADFPEALINRSDIYRVENKIDSAILDCTHAIKIDPKNDGAYVNRGIALSIAGRYDEALSDFNKALELNPDNIKPYSNRANLLAMKGDYEKSLADYARVLENDPNNLDAYANRARTYFSMKNFDEALKDVNVAIEIKPDKGDNFVLRSDIQNGKGNYLLALNDALRAQQLGSQVNPEYMKVLQQKANAGQ